MSRGRLALAAGLGGTAALWLLASMAGPAIAANPACPGSSLRCPSALVTGAAAAWPALLGGAAALGALALHGPTAARPMRAFGAWGSGMGLLGALLLPLAPGPPAGLLLFLGGWGLAFLGEARGPGALRAGALAFAALVAAATLLAVLAAGG